MGSDKNQVLVSVGIPTYNRPEGLRRTLLCILQQTYKNIEIIVSDNCSKSDEVSKVVHEFSENDSRIKYYKQSSQIGINNNFRFVFSKSCGKYFMWAADDDEWDKDFITACIDGISSDESAVSSMPKFKISNRYYNRIEDGELPNILPSNTNCENALRFLNCVTPSMFYGLHDRKIIEFILEDEFFEFYDCYFILKLLLNGKIVIVNRFLYMAGIDAPTYQLKSSGSYRFMRLRYLPFFFKSVKVISNSSCNYIEKGRMIAKLLYVTCSFFWFHEVKYRIE